MFIPRCLSKCSKGDISLEDSVEVIALYKRKELNFLRYYVPRALFYLFYNSLSSLSKLENHSYIYP